MELTLTHEIQLCTSKAILSEYADVLQRPKLRLNPTAVAALLLDIEESTQLVGIDIKLAISPDEDDNRFLECAEASSADYLVTGNKRHFPPAHGKTKIVNAREFLDMISQ